MSVSTDHRYVGEGAMSHEGSSEVAYVWRAATCTPHPRPRSAHVGEIGWGIPTYTDWNAPNTGTQITESILLHFFPSSLRIFAKKFELVVDFLRPALLKALFFYPLLIEGPIFFCDLLHRRHISQYLPSNTFFFVNDI